MSPQLLKLIGKRRLNRLGRALSPLERADVARGALLENIPEGKDKTAQSIKLLGQDRTDDLSITNRQAASVTLQPQALTVALLHLTSRKVT